MRELVKKLYFISGKESSKISRMLFFEVIKSIFEGVSLGAIMLLLLKVFQNIFENRTVVMQDIYLVFLIALVAVIGKIIFGYMADRNKYIATYNIGADNRLYIGDKLKQVNMGYFSRNRLGDISGGLTTIIGELETVGVNIIETFFVGVIQTAIMAVFMLPFDIITGCIILGTLMLGMISNALFQHKADQLTQKLQSLKVNLTANTLEYIKGIGVIKSFGKGREMLEELDKSIHDNRKGFLNVEKTVAPATLIFLFIFKLGIGAIVLSTVLRFCFGQIDPYKAVVLLVSSFIVFS